MLLERGQIITIIIVETVFVNCLLTANLHSPLRNITLYLVGGRQFFIYVFFTVSYWRKDEQISFTKNTVALENTNKGAPLATIVTNNRMSDIQRLLAVVCACRAAILSWSMHSQVHAKFDLQQFGVGRLLAVTEYSMQYSLLRCIYVHRFTSFQRHKHLDKVCAWYVNNYIASTPHTQSIEEKKYRRKNCCGCWKEIKTP